MRSARVASFLLLLVAACGGTGEEQQPDVPEPRCGDGKLNEGEECDLGDGLNSDTEPDRCRTDCTDARCGDGVVDELEDCDDGNTEDTDACRNTCVKARCGDGVVQPPESCDAGAENSDTAASACRTTCVNHSCGDGVVDLDEECDDGNEVDGDVCTNACRPGTCGDGILWPATEECDEGPANSDLLSDTCRTNCKNPSCGDGVADASEDCDDGNDDDTDACVADCKAASCGDGLTWEGEEECDEGQFNDDIRRDACRTDCRNHYCGDGIIDSDEQCDDQNDDTTDLCIPGCRLARCGDGFVRTGSEECDLGEMNGNMPGALCRLNCKLPACHDGVKDAGEECDDGNIIDTDACVGECLVAFCGDGYVQKVLEQCDDGELNSEEPDACRPDCVSPYCGDLIVDSTEECEDGNDIETDACIACKDAFCGDGILWEDNGEVCDEGAKNSDGKADACRTTCVPAKCGDGTIDSRESCDDGNDVDGDGCSASCYLEAKMPLAGKETVIKGDIDGNESTFQRPGELDTYLPGCRADPGNYTTYYKVYEVKNDTGADQTILVEGIWDDFTGAGDSEDGYVIIYNGSFDADDPLTDCASASDDFDPNPDDDNERQRASRTGAVTIKDGDTAYVIATSWNSEIVMGKYTLHLENAGITVEDTEANNDLDTAQPIEDAIGWVHGELTPAGDDDWYSFDAIGGTDYRIEVLSQQGYCSDVTNYEIYLQVYDANENQQVSASDHWYFDYDPNTGYSGCAGAMWYPENDGTYYFRVTEENGETAIPYYLTVRVQ